MTQQTNQQVVAYKNISEEVLMRIDQLQDSGSLILPKDYAVGNNLKSAWLKLQETTTKDGKPVLSACTKESISNSLLDMVVQGLSVSKGQGYFIACGQKLEFWRSYQGTMALAKQLGGISRDPKAQVIYEDDEFEYEIDVNTAETKILSHKQKLANIKMGKIVGAYVNIQHDDGSSDVTLMTMEQIRAAWNMGASKGNSPAHRNFPDEMAKKTVINRACKTIIGASKDSWLFEGKKDSNEDLAEVQRAAAQNAPKKEVVIEEAAYEEVAAPAEKKEAPVKKNEKPVIKVEEQPKPQQPQPAQTITFEDNEEAPY